MDVGVMTRVLERLKARFPEAGHLDSDAQMQALVDRVPRAEFRKMMKEEEDRAAQQARWYPASDEVTADHNMKRIQYALLHAQESMEGMRVDTGWAAPRTAGGGTTVQKRVRLEGLRTSAAPLRGTVAGGVLAAPSFRFRPSQGAVNCLLREEGTGAVVRLALYDIPLRDCREGRRELCLHGFFFPPRGRP